MSVSLLISKTIAQVMEKPVEQPKVPVPKISRIHDELVPIPDYTFPHISSGDDSSSRMVKRKAIYRMLLGKFPYIQIQFTDPLLNQ